MRRAAIIALGIVLGLYAFLVALPPIWDTDIWWHLRVGEWIVEHGALPTTDVFSAIEPERAWRSFWWLFELLVYGLHEAFGPFALRLLTASIAVAAYILWWRLFLRETRSQVVSLALIILLILLFDDRIRVRPHMFNFLGEALLIPWLMAGMRLSGMRQRATLFALFALWANLHNPGAVIGVALVFVASVMRVAIARVAGESQRAAIREVVWPIGLCAIAVIATPYGPALLLAAKDNIAPVHDAIGEWQPVLSYLARGGSVHHMIAAVAPYVALLLACGVVLTRTVKRTLASSENIAWLKRASAPLCCLALSLGGMRFVYFAVVPLAWIISLTDFRATVRRLAAGVMAAGLFAASYAYSVVDNFGGVSPALRSLAVDVKPHHFPESAATLIREAGLKGRVFSLTNWGGYLNWFARPPSGVVVDARYNLSPRVFAELREVEKSVGSDGARLVRALDALGVAIAVLPRDAFPFDEWPRAAWMRAAHDSVAETFVRRTSEDVARIAQFVGAVAAPVETVERAATRFFGERHCVSIAERIHDLERAGNHAATHALALIEWRCGRSDSAVTRLRSHLRALPNCLQGATELARVLHAEGRAAEAYRLLRIAEGAPNLPTETTRWINHLRAHAPQDQLHQ